MTQLFHHYKKWEDYHAGMFRKVTVTDDHSLIVRAYKLLSTPELCLSAMRRVLVEWPFSTQHNITNLSQNRRAWLGQAACCIEFGVPEELTKIAWNNLSKELQDQANSIADKVINEYA